MTMSSKCVTPGCSKNSISKGYCKAHYNRFISRPKERQLKKQEIEKQKVEDKVKQAEEKAGKYTREQLEKVFLAKCTKEKDLKNFLKYFFDIQLPDCIVSRYADSSPFHSLWEMYEITVLNNNPQHINEIIYVAGRGSGKCGKKGTKIITLQGPKNIEDVVVGDRVWTGWSLKPVTAWFDEGVKAGVTVATKKGSKVGSFSLTGSLKHRIQAFNQATNKIDWVLMKDLQPGQLVYKSAEQVYSKTISITSEDYEKGWILGNITGDGCVSRHNNLITLCGTDSEQIRFYNDLIQKLFSITPVVKKSSKSALINNVNISNKDFRSWHDSFISGELCYFKKLKTLDHSPNFLAGFIAGLMETDGSKDSITFANKELAEQVAQILTIFGVSSAINNARRPPSTTKFQPGHIVTYHEVVFNKLPDCMLPLFSKRQTFIDFRDKQNEQFRYPSVLIHGFANFIKGKYKIANGYWKLDSGKKTHSNIKYSKDLWGDSAKGREGFVYGYKIDTFIELAERLNENSWASYLRFIRNGYYETVDSVTFEDAYFYDLEVEQDHSYCSNGFISHNTLSVSLAQLLAVIHGQRDVVHVGAIQSQAKRAYEYIQKYLLGEQVKTIVAPGKVTDDMRILKKSTMERTTLRIGGIDCTIEIVPCTLKSVNGPHVSFVSVDEVDTISGENLKAYKDISGMLDSKRGKAPLRVNISTRKTRYGLMESQIATAEKTGKSVRRWTALEFMQRCPDERSGTEITDFYVSVDEGSALTNIEWEKLSDAKKKEYENISAYNKCNKCPLLPWCRGDAKNQKSVSPMLKPVNEIAAKVLSEGPDWTSAQLFNLKPSVEGIIYKEFEERTHVKNWNGMWEVLTGKMFPGTCDHDTFIRKCHQMGLQSYVGMDFGWSNPSTVVVFFVDSKENIYVVRADGITYRSHPEWIHYVKNRYHQIYRSQLYHPDPADPGDLVEMRKAGLPANPNVDKGNISTGVQVIKKWLRAPMTLEPKMFFAEETTKPIIKEFTLYHYKTSADGSVTEDPDTEWDHYLDALRYAMQSLFGKNSVIVDNNNNDVDMSQVISSQGHLFKVPTGEEYAKIVGLPLNDAHNNKDLLGKIGKLTDLDGGDDENNSDGGFLWSL
jgi:hypothetical protein